jgi:transposase
MDLEDLIPANHVVRIVNDTVERMDDELFFQYYPGGGRSSFHPKMLTKVLVYAYTQRIYSSRQIAKALRENIHFMWLSARQTPDFRTINRFRSERMKDIVEQVFAAVLELLIDEGYVKFEHYFLDGTKIEANANRYTFVWKKSTDRLQSRLQTQIRELLTEIEQANQQEQREYGERDLEELGQDQNQPVTSEQLDTLVTSLEQQLSESPKNKPLRKAIRKIRKDYLPRCEKYETQQATFQDRNSFSKTDPDATFMRMRKTT